MNPETIRIGTAVAPLEIHDGRLYRLGAVTLAGAALRHPRHPLTAVVRRV